MTGDLTGSIDKILEAIDSVLEEPVPDTPEEENDIDEPDDCEVDHEPDSFNPQEVEQPQATEQPDEPGRSEATDPEAGDPDGGKA